MMNEKVDIEEVAPWLVILITLIGGGLRILLLDHKGMWLDETFSIWLANHSVVDMLQWIGKIDRHPPLYYLLLHYWVALKGDTPYHVRLLSALLGAGTIPMIYLIGKRMSGVKIGLAAAALLALSPFHIRFAQETRMYTCLTFNASVAIYALVRLLTDSRSARPIGSQLRNYLHAWRISGPVEPGTEGDLGDHVDTRNQTGWRARIARHRWLPIQTIETDLAWTAYIVFSAATMLSHNAAVLFLPATHIFVLGLMFFQRTRKSGARLAFHAPPLGNWIKAQIGILLLWSPWLLGFVNQASRVCHGFWLTKPSWDTVIQALGSFLNEYTRGQSSQMQMIWILYGLVLCLGVLHDRRDMSRFLFLAALFAIPFLSELIVSIRRPIFCDRTLIWTTIPLFLVLAAGIVQLRFRFLMIVAVGILGLINLLSAADYFKFVQKEDWHTAAGYVANFAQKDDLVLFNTAWGQIPFDYYFEPYQNLYSIHVERQGMPVDTFESGIPERNMTDRDVPMLISGWFGNRVTH